MFKIPLTHSNGREKRCLHLYLAETAIINNTVECLCETRRWAITAIFSDALNIYLQIYIQERYDYQFLLISKVLPGELVVGQYIIRERFKNVTST